MQTILLLLLNFLIHLHIILMFLLLSPSQPFRSFCFYISLLCSSFPSISLCPSVLSPYLCFSSFTLNLVLFPSYTPSFSLFPFYTVAPSLFLFYASPFPFFLALFFSLLYSFLLPVSLLLSPPTSSLSIIISPYFSFFTLIPLKLPLPLSLPLFSLRLFH